MGDPSSPGPPGQGQGSGRRPRRPHRGGAPFDAGPGARAFRSRHTPATNGAAKDLARARTLGEARAQRFRLSGYQPVAAAAGAKLEDLFEQISRGETATLNIVLKADVQGSLEAVTESLQAPRTRRREVELRPARHRRHHRERRAAGSGLDATIIGFNVRPDKRSRELAEIVGRRDPDLRDHLQAARGPRGGHARPALTALRGGRDGRGRGARGVPSTPDRCRGRLLRARRQITRGSRCVLARGYGHLEGRDQLARRFKDDVREVAAGFECGIGPSDFQDLKEGDLIETYDEREVART